jgi:hypothetical protein
MTIQFSSDPVLLSYRSDHNDRQEVMHSHDDVAFEFDYPLEGDESSTITSFFSHDDSTILSDFDSEDLEVSWISGIDFSSKAPQRRYGAARPLSDWKR